MGHHHKHRDKKERNCKRQGDICNHYNPFRNGAIVRRYAGYYRNGLDGRGLTGNGFYDNNLYGNDFYANNYYGSDYYGYNVNGYQ